MVSVWNHIWVVFLDRKLEVMLGKAMLGRYLNK